MPVSRVAETTRDLASDRIASAIYEGYSVIERDRFRASANLQL